MKHIFLIICTLVSLVTSAQYTLKATKYHPGINGVGYITADGSRINVSKLRNYEIRWVALSHDMFTEFKLKDTIQVESDNPNLRGLWIVKDKTHPRLRKHIDFLLPYGDTLNFNYPIKVIIKPI